VQINFSLSQSANVAFEILASLPNADNDSFHYKMDAGAWAVQNNQSTSGFGNIAVATFNNLAAGNHTLRISRREDGAILDRVKLTPSTGSIAGF
jgi:arabinoxylan arabinofuranohydrolase